MIGGGIPPRPVSFGSVLLALALACCGGRPTHTASSPAAPPATQAIDIAANRTLLVGPGHALKLPSEAARIARDGDTVLIDPGSYDDCAIWRQNQLTIAASGPGVVFSDKTCGGKAIFVIDGTDVTVRGITFMHAVVRDHNGAGIRLHDGNLLVDHDRFIDNEEGILGGETQRSTVRVVDSEFRGNGNCIGECAHGLYVGRIALLDVEHSRFTDTHEGHDIKSRALRTVLRGNDISDGPTGHASYLVDISNGGDVLMEHNTFSKGPHTDNDTTAISIGAEKGRNPTRSLVIRDNIFTNLLPKPTAFVTNHTDTPVELANNKFVGKVVPLVGPGTAQK